MSSDRQRDEEMEITRQEMERTKEEMKRTKQELDDLKALISASNLISSPMLDKASCEVQKEGPNEAVKTAVKVAVVKECIFDDVECVDVEPPHERRLKVVYI